MSLDESRDNSKEQQQKQNDRVQHAGTNKEQPEDQAEAECAYPTDAAERKRNAKRAAKEAGVEWITKPRKKAVEEHYDDCGEDFSAIEASLSHYGSTSVEDELTETDSDEEFIYVHAQCGVEQFALLGPNLTGIPTTSQGVELFASADRLFSYLSTSQPPTEPADTADYVELCSCYDGTDRIAVRKTSRLTALLLTTRCY